jgi:hypothetical protein
MAMQRATIGAVLAIAVMGVVASALGVLVANRTIPNTGNIRVVTPPPPPPPPQTVQLGIYSDSGCTTVLSSIPWGTLDPGGSTSATAYLKNEGNVQVMLSMTYGNWTPSSASSYFTLSWDRQSYVLSVGSVVQATLTLSVSSSISGITTFSFDITITATQ